jgi:hypothetical protein
MRSRTPEAETASACFDVGDDVVDVLDAHRDAHQILRDAGARQFLGVELAVRGRGRVAGERLGVADVDQPQDHLQRVDELGARVLARP